ncbi:MAG: hypothetical protein ACO1PZ_15395 [Gammaproteobacteria bacterium]
MGRPDFSELMPWAGLIAGFGAAALQHQLVSSALHFDCSYGGANPLVGLVALVIIAIGTALSWRALHRASDPEGSRRFVAHLSFLAAAISALLVAWMTLAGWILPACAP